MALSVYRLDPSVREFWRRYPVRIPGGSECWQCKQETVLVQSMDGGFVTRNCPRCNKPSTLPDSIFKGLALWVACPRCKSRMKPQVLPDRNYGYVCASCEVGVPLFELVPRWEDL